MSSISQAQFFKTMPDQLLPLLPPNLHGIKPHQPWKWLIQFHFGERRLHYEISKVARRPAYEIGLHLEARDAQLNRLLLLGFRRHLFEIKAVLGEQIEAEMWDRGWSKIYEIYPAEPLTLAYQQAVAMRCAEIITVLHPIFLDLRSHLPQSR